jgi:hypothetical protein
MSLHVGKPECCAEGCRTQDLGGRRVDGGDARLSHRIPDSFYSREEMRSGILEGGGARAAAGRSRRLRSPNVRFRDIPEPETPISVCEVFTSSYRYKELTW